MAEDLPKILRALLRPVAIFALRNQLKIDQILASLKSILVSVAAEELESNFEKITKSRVAVMTGLPRRDVADLLEGRGTIPKPQNMLAKIIGHWQSHPKYIKGGKPRSLTVSGSSSEFFSLVQSVSKDINPYTVLFEFERTGVVEKKGEHVNLIRPAYEPKDNVGEGLALWSQDAEDLMKSVDENVTGKSKVPNLHITTRYDNICADAVGKIQVWLLERGAAFHAEMRSYLSQFDKDLNPSLFEKKGGNQVSITSFSRVIEEIDGKTVKRE